MKTVVFFANTTIIPGLHVSLLSFLESLEFGLDEEFKVVVFSDRIPDHEKEAIHRTVELANRKIDFEIQEFEPACLPGANALHGNQTAYGRVYLADLLPDTDQCLYLDSDLIIRGSVHEIFSQFDGVNVLLADGAYKRTRSADATLFENAGLNMSGYWFNSGVLGMDLKLWRSRMMAEKCRDIAQRFEGQFRTADQALLNVVFGDNFVKIGRHYNFPLYPAANAEVKDEAILHLVGSPKPWDFGGRTLSLHFERWHRLYQRTALANCPLSRYWSISRIAHTLPILSRTAIQRIKRHSR